MAALAVVACGLRAAGPLILGGRRPAPAVQRALDLLPAALFAALVATGTLTSGTALVVDARVAGLAAAAAALLARAPMPLVLVAAAAATALARAAS